MRGPPSPIRATARALTVLAVVALLSSTALIGVAAGQATPPATCRHYRCERWDRHVAGPADGTPAAVVHADGRVVVAATEGGDLLTVAYDADDGRTLWQDRLAGVEARDVTVADGRVVATGTDGDAVTAAWDLATGQRLWTDRFDDGSREAGLTVAASAKHGFAYVGGHYTGRFGDEDLLFLMYDLDDGGPPASVQIYGFGDERIVELTLGPDGDALYALSPGRDDEIARYDASTGTVDWTATFGDDRDAAPTAIAVEPGGDRVHVTGTGDDSYRTQAHDAADGSRRWARSFSSPVVEEARPLDVTVVAGRVAATGTAGTVAYDRDGTPVWFNTLPTWRGTRIDPGPRNQFLYLARTGGEDLRLHGLDPVTGLIWASARHDDARDRLVDMAVGGREVALTGATRDGGDADVTTVTFEPEPRLDPPEPKARGCGDVGAEVGTTSGQVLWIDVPGYTVPVCVEEDHGASVSPPGDEVPCPNRQAGSGSGGFQVGGVGAWVCYGDGNDEVWVDTSPCTTPEGREAVDPGAGVPGLWVAVCAWADEGGGSLMPQIETCTFGAGVTWLGSDARVCVGPGD